MVKDKNPIYSWSLFCPKVSRVRVRSQHSLLSLGPSLEVPSPHCSLQCTLWIKAERTATKCFTAFLVEINKAIKKES